MGRLKEQMPQTLTSVLGLSSGADDLFNLKRRQTKRTGPTAKLFLQAKRLQGQRMHLRKCDLGSDPCESVFFSSESEMDRS